MKTKRDCGKHQQVDNIGKQGSINWPSTYNYRDMKTKWTKAKIY